jgi:hypothetical protein
MEYKITKVEVLDETIQTTVKYDLIADEVMVSNFAPKDEQEILDTIETVGKQEVIKLQTKLERVTKNEEIAKKLSSQIEEQNGRK